MQLGMVGLGRMGGNMVKRLQRGGHECVVYARTKETREALAKDGATPAESLEDMVKKLKAPRVVWLMLPAGDVTDQNVKTFAGLLGSGDTVVEGGNSYFKDDIRRAREVTGPKGISYVDVGVSGGVWGLERGYCQMIGGPKDAVQRLNPVFKTLAPGQGDVEPTAGRTGSDSASEGYLHCGPTGAGHFVKMVHNGIEYGIMQAYAEGFDLMKAVGKDTVKAEEKFDIPLASVAELWRRGSVIGSWLLDLTARALTKDDTLKDFSGQVNDSGEGRWTINTAIEHAVPVEVLSSALYTRFRSRQGNTYAEKLLSAMRWQFGGHVEPGKGGH